MKDLVKRNVQIKKSYELEKKGLMLNPYLFEREANLLRECKRSKTVNYNHLYDELHQKAMRRLDKPAQMADYYILARVYKYVLIKSGKVEEEKV